MKKSFVLLMIFFAGWSLSAQKTISDVFDNGEVVWYGLDFSQAQFVEVVDSEDGEEIKDKWIPSWNDLIIRESKKFDMGKFFKKKTVVNDLAAVKAVNQSIDETKIIVDSSTPFDDSEKTIASAISEYEGGKQTEGLGLVFIVEYFDKSSLEGAFYVVFFDISSKKTLLSKRMIQPPAGFGVRNYWAGTIYNSLRLIDKKEWKKWKKDNE